MIKEFISDWKIVIKVITNSVSALSLAVLAVTVIMIWKSGNVSTPTAVPPVAANAQNPAPAQPTTGTASVDDDAVLGDKNAPVTLIEFSDYECPFCKKYFTDTFPQIKAKYIDTGKVKLVFRDLPLPFHEPMATKEAIAANCARKQKNDDMYFKYHDEMFKQTTSNGTGLNDEKLKTIATGLSLNLNSFESCLKDKAMEDEVKKDLADASAAGANGTPSFIVGKSTSNGTVQGSLVVGAQPFAAFEAVIDPLLK